MKRKISAVVLAGGLGRRMGYVDKGLQAFNGKTLIEQVLQSIAPQVDEIIISCNQNHARYKTFGYPLVKDYRDDFAGPLAGIFSAVEKISYKLCLIVPCDMPYLPADFVQQLLDHKLPDRPISISNNGKRQPLLSLVDTESIGEIEARLRNGQHAVHQWLTDQNGTELNYKQSQFDGMSDPFLNINTQQDLAPSTK